LWGTAEIAGVYAGFSPVLPDSEGEKQQRVVVSKSLYNNLLCFGCGAAWFPIRHIFALAVS
jgi:hypothetical protein